MGGVSSIAERIALRYGRALHAVAKRDNCCASVQKDFENLTEILSKMPSLERFIANPTKPSSVREKALQLVAAKMKAHQVTSRLLNVLAQRARLPLLLNVGRHFTDLCNKDDNNMNVAVTVAHPLTDSQEKELTSVIGKAYGKNVFLIMKQDKSLLGGLKLELEGRLYDASIKTRLERVCHQLNAKGAVSWT